MRRASLLALAVCVFIEFESRAADPAADRLTFTGSAAVGTTSITFAAGVYSFRFVGDETITYELDLNDAKVKGGQITIREVASDSRPIEGGGFLFRHPNNAVWFPKDLYPKTTLLQHSVSGKTLTIDYLLDFNGPHPVRYQYSIEGKTLRIRVFDPAQNVNLYDNFAGLFFGTTTKVESPVAIHMQGSLAPPLVLFRNGTLHYFTANMLDMFQSNASDYDIVDTFAPQKGADWIDLNYDSTNTYRPLSNGKLAAPLDDTFVIAVSSKVKDVLLTSTAPPTPYHSLLSTRLFFNGPETQWSYYSGMFDLYQSLGMYNLAGYFFKWSASANDPPAIQNVGPDWTPPLDPPGFQAMLAKGTKFGAVLGAYTGYNSLPPTAAAPVQDPSLLVKDAAGNTKPYLQLGFPLLAVEAAGERAKAEALAMRTLGLNAGYLDIHTYGSISKGPDGDHIDQQATSPWAKTQRVGFAAQKHWFDSIRAMMQGPLMGEGSIATQNTNMEFLWYGYCDSVQRCVNSGAGKSSIELPANSPQAPTNWPIVPEYEWRVAARKQVNHGNGFYDRFFHVGDGPAIVEPSTKTVITPLGPEARDLYRAYELAYGHAGFITTNGTQSTTQGYLTHAAAADIYFMSNALQPFLFLVPVVGIHYRHGGTWKTFEQIVFQSESIEPFRKIPIAITFATGGRLYVNTGTTPLTVQQSGVEYVLPARTGWLADFPGFVLAFSAIAPGTNGKRIDYCNATGQYEYFNGRGAVTGYGSLSTPFNRIRYRVATANLDVTEDANGILQITAGSLPTPNSIILLGGPGTLASGEKRGLKAVSVYPNGAFRDITTLVTWSSSNNSVAAVNASGVVGGRNPGTCQITVSGPPTAVVTPITITVP
jgi:hypothetical protein